MSAETNPWLDAAGNPPTEMLPDEPNMTQILAAAEARGRASRDGEVDRYSVRLAESGNRNFDLRAERDAARAEVATLTREKIALSVELIRADVRHEAQVEQTTASRRHADAQRAELARLSADRAALLDSSHAWMAACAEADRLGIKARAERDAARLDAAECRRRIAYLESAGYLADAAAVQPDPRAGAHEATADGGCRCASVLP